MNNLRAHISKFQKPPAALKNESKEKKKSKSKPRIMPEWQDISLGGDIVPQYMVAEDKFASGYLAGLKRQGRLKPFLNLVYQNKASMRPGHIRPSQYRATSNQIGAARHPKSNIDAESNLDSVQNQSKSNLIVLLCSC